jgi:hypothetical protein
MNTEFEKDLIEFRGILFTMLDGKEVFVEADDDFKVEMKPLLNTEQEIAAYNALHPEQHTSLKYLTREEIKEQYGTDIPY